MCTSVLTTTRATRTRSPASARTWPSIRSRSWTRTASSRSQFATSRRRPAGRRASRRRRTPGSTRPGRRWPWRPSRRRRRAPPGRPRRLRPRSSRRHDSRRAAPRPPARRRSPRIVKVLRAPIILAVVALLCVVAAEAGHEITFYPSYYPHEITVRFAEPARAAALLGQKKIHAYAGGDPFAGGAAPAHVRWAESFDGFVVLSFPRPAGAFAQADARCAAGAAFLRALGARAPFVVHPYPVTPYHEGYGLHYDLVQRARDRAPGRTPRVRAGGALGQAVAAAGLAGGANADATLQWVPLAALLAEVEARLLGWTGPPWLKEGWFHAWLLRSSSWPLQPAPTGQAADAFRRRTEGAWQTPAERVNLERRLVAEAGAGCERVVLGYTVRREPLHHHYPPGGEKVAAGSQAGGAAPNFLPTAEPQGISPDPPPPP